MDRRRCCLGDTRFRAPLLCVALSLGYVALGGADWTGFRGPKSLGISEEKNLPVTWSNSENLVWKTPLPGPGSSSPITSGNRIYLTCCTGYGTGKAGETQEDLRRLLIALDRDTGKIVWQKEVAAKLPETEFQGNMTRHSFASSTPATDGKHIFVFFGKTGVFAFDLEGNQLWQADVGSGIHGWNSASSPVLYKDLVIVNAAVESRSIVALDKLSGKQVWRVTGINNTWGTPVLVDAPDGSQELVLSKPRVITGYEPATGKELWRCEGIDDGYLCTSVVSKDGVVYVVGGRRDTGAVAVKVGGRGDVTKTHRLWTQRARSNVPSPVYHDGHIYCISDGGIAYCLTADTGEIVYQERLQRAQPYASALAADGKIYVVTRSNGTYVLAAQPKFKQLAHNQLQGDTSLFNASPAVDRGRLLLRSDQALYCIGQK